MMPDPLNPDPRGPIAGALFAAAVIAGVAAWLTHGAFLGAGPLAFAVHPLAAETAPRLRVDGLSRLAAFIVGLTVPIILLYLARATAARAGPMVPAFILATAGTLGLAAADDLVGLFLFGQVTVLGVGAAILRDDLEPHAARAALMALVLNGVGSLVLLAGLALLAGVAGTLQLDLLASGDSTAHRTYPLILACILIGAACQSALWPLHFWLPAIMAVPAPLLALLQSTLLVNGVYLLARLAPALGGSELWFWSLSGVGAASAVWGALMALRQTDLKAVMAWTTVMSLGTIVMFLGAGSGVTTAAALTFLLVHAFYKSALCLIVGNVELATGMRRLDRLGGLARVMPFTASAATLGALSMAGFPPFLGFIGKELKYEGALAIAEEPLPLALAAMLASATVIGMAKALLLLPFFRRGGVPAGSPLDLGRVREVPTLLWLGPGLLALAGLVLGLAPDLIGRVLITPAMESILGRYEPLKLAHWHGLTLPLLLSLASISAGALLFLARRPVRAVLEALAARLPFSGERLFDWMVARIGPPKLRERQVSGQVSTGIGPDQRVPPTIDGSVGTMKP